MTYVTSLTILDFGLFEVFGAEGNGRFIGIPGYLIQTADRQSILVDTGFRPEYARFPE